MTDVVKMRPLWCKEACWSCGQEGYATRTMPKPADAPYVCDVCRESERHDDEMANAVVAERENAARICDNEAWWCESHAKSTKGAARNRHAGIAQVMRTASHRIRQGERSNGDCGDKSMMTPSALDAARAEGFATGRAVERARCVRAIAALRDAVATGEQSFEGNTSCFADEMDGLIKIVESGNE